MNNGKISLRQCKRLLFFDILGLGLMFLPDMLARKAGRDGGLAIAFVVLLAEGYLFLLFRWNKKWDKKNTWFQKFVYMVFGFYFLVLGGYETFLLSDLVETFLLPQENYVIIALLIVLLAMYSRKKGMEGRARVFEILFWPMVILLVFFLALGVGEVKPMYLFPMGVSLVGMTKGLGVVGIAFGVVAMTAFLPEVLEDGVPIDDLRKGMQSSVFLAGIFLLVMYEILLGSFGEQALGDSKLSLMIFSSNLVLPGGFLRRQEALVAGVCFVAVMALLGSSIQYAQHCFSQIKTANFWVYFCSGVILLLGIWEDYHISQTKELLWCLSLLTPVALLSPFFLKGKERSSKKTMVLGVFAVVAFTCTGCSIQELENKSFPMVIGLGSDDGNCKLNYKYMDLSQVSEKEKTKQGSDELQVSATTVLGAMSLMDQKNGKTMDLNHAKVLLVEKSFLEQDELVEQLMKESNRGATLSGNMMVLATDSIEEIGELQNEMDGDVGSYMEELVRGNTCYKNTKDFSLKTWISEWYEGDYLSVIPKVSVEGSLPVISGYYGYLKAERTSQGEVFELSTTQGLCAGICQGTVEEMDLPMGKGVVRLKNFRVSYEFSESNSRVICTVHMKGDIDKNKSVYNNARHLVEEELCGIIRSAWEEQQVDLSNSYGHLHCHDRNIYEQYKNDFDDYQKKLQLDVECELKELY